MSKKGVFLVFLLFAVLGLVFSATSVYDSIAHLDREIHSVSCSFIPGGGQDDKGESGCYAVMMSPYSSVFQAMTWGGIPIALGSLAVFAYLLFLGIELMLAGASDLEPKKTYYLIAAAAFPLAISMIYLGISLNFIGEICKTCAGIYISSLGVFVGSIIAHTNVSNQYNLQGGDKSRSDSLPWGYYFRSFFEGVIFVAIVVGVFLAVKPAYSEKAHECGNLIHQQDPDSVMIPLRRVAGGATAIEIADPLCPACQMFRDRLEASTAAKALDLRAVLFPLESDCNWMVSETMHPGACMVAEAVLCAKNNGVNVMNWALDNHASLRTLAKESKASLKRRIIQEFPSVANCVDTTESHIKVNKSLRWIVSNSSRVMTPQLFVNGVRLCEEDTDLGLEFALTKLLEKEPFIPPVRTNQEALERMRAVAPVEPQANTPKADGGPSAPASPGLIPRKDGGVDDGAQDVGQKPDTPRGVPEGILKRTAPLQGETEKDPIPKANEAPLAPDTGKEPQAAPPVGIKPAAPKEPAVPKEPAAPKPDENPDEGGEAQ